MRAAGTATAAPPFDVCGPLPSGTVVLEASAGTGKTFTIAALATRYVAAGTPLGRLLIVTFTRMATGELRERVRDHLVSAERGLARAAAGVPVPPDDAVLRLLADADAATVEARRQRLAAALSDFDAATIATTHGFCQHILTGLGITGDAQEGVTIVDDADDLVDEVVDDLYLRRFALTRSTPSGPEGRERPPFDREEARRIGRLAVEHPTAPIEPHLAPAQTEGAMRRRLAMAVRAEVERRKRQAGIVTYDDLLIQLAATLRHPRRGPAACARLRERYRVALVDEFQDTDPVQWEILRRAFTGDDPAEDGAARAPASTLVLIGDPKQAIYAFRGADVHTYLDAARHAATRATLETNWRCDQGLIDACDALLGGTRLGHDDIVLRTVRAAPSHREPRLIGAHDPAALRVRIVERDGGHVELTPKGYASTASALAVVARDLAADVVELLSGKAELVERAPDGTDSERTPVRPGHLAVLVRTHRHGALVRDALGAAGVPAVLNGAGSVFATPAARDWLTLLEALERPSSPPRAHAVALAPFIGWTAHEVAGAGDDRWEHVYARLHSWSAVLRRRGVAALVEAVTSAEGLPQRLLSRPDGERALTDLRHIGELLHVETVAADLGGTALAGWLRRRIAEAPGDGHHEDRARRLESDAEAVQILTIHRSKGLEFPIVYAPFLWEPGWVPERSCPVFHDPANGNQRTIDVARGGRDLAEHRLAQLAEVRGEDLRLAYVALTRARHQVVLWWASSWESRNSPLARLLSARDGEGRVDPEGSRVPTEAEIAEWFGAMAGDAPGTISVAAGTTGDGRRWTATGADRPQLGTRRFERALDPDWRRTSYTAIITALRHGTGARDGTGAHEPEPGERGVADEDLPETPAGGPPAPAGTGEPVPLAPVPGGAAVGSLLHAVLEATDFAAGDLDTELAGHLATQQERLGTGAGDPAAVVAGLRAAIETPLGPLAGGMALRAVDRCHRLDELDFELPLAGGDEPHGLAPTVAAIGALLGEHLPAGDPLAGYAELLSDPPAGAGGPAAAPRRLKGFLNGSIDLVLRVGGGGGDARFAVVDYKTNRLAAPGEDLTAWHYRPEALAEAMAHGHYPLQALLYSVALHRYLRWRLPGYDPGRHLGGVLYLFLRGMTGPPPRSGAGDPASGVFSWAPPPGLVPALSDLLDGPAGPGRPAGAGAAP